MKSIITLLAANLIIASAGFAEVTAKDCDYIRKQLAAMTEQLDVVNSNAQPAFSEGFNSESELTRELTRDRQSSFNASIIEISESMDRITKRLDKVCK